MRAKFDKNFYFHCYVTIIVKLKGRYYQKKLLAEICNKTTMFYYLVEIKKKYY